MMLFYPKEHGLKILSWYLNWKCVRKGGSRRGVLGWHWGFLTGDMDDRVIPDIMNDVYLALGRYSENFLRLYLFQKFIKRGHYVFKRQILQLRSPPKNQFQSPTINGHNSSICWLLREFDISMESLDNEDHVQQTSNTLTHSLHTLSHKNTQCARNLGSFSRYWTNFNRFGI